jgi:hypothetical protein
MPLDERLSLAMMAAARVSESAVWVVTIALGPEQSSADSKN